MDGYQRDIHLSQIDSAINQLNTVIAQLDGLDASIATADLKVASAARGQLGHEAQTAVGRLARSSQSARSQARAARNKLEQLRGLI